MANSASSDDEALKKRSAAPAPARRSVGFQAAHARKFGLLVTQRDPETGAVLAVACLFCRHEGREAKEGRKRKVTANCKEFRLSFRTDQYTQHLNSQHPRAWARYCAASEVERRTFFPVVSSATAADSVSDKVGDAGDVRTAVAKTPLRRIAPKKPRLSTTSSPLPPTPSTAAPTPAPAPAVATPTAAPVASDLVTLVENGAPAAPVKSDAAEPAETAAVEPTQSTLAAEKTGVPASPSAIAAVETPASFDVRKQLVDLVLGGEQVWRPTGCLTCELLTDDDPEARAVYRVTVRQQTQQELAIDLAALGLNPRQIAKTLTATVTRTGLDPVLAATEEEAVELVWLSTVVCLDAISKLLQRCWGYSIGVRTAERSTDLEVSLRVYSGSRVHSVHLVAIPVSDRQSADVPAMFESFERVISAVFPAWRSYLIGLGSDGDSTMGDHVAQFVTRVQQEVPHTVYSSWCGSAQLDIAMQQFYHSLLGGAFVPSFKALRAYICSQESLVQDMNHPPSAASTNPWFDMGNDAKWVTDKRVRLRKHLEEEKPLAAPSDSWWVAFFVVHWISSRSNETTKKLQSKNLVVAQQTALLLSFVEEVVLEFSIQGPFNASDDPDTASNALVETASDDLVFSTQRQYAVAKASILEFIGDLGVFVRNIVARTNAAGLDAVAESLAVCLVNLVETLTSMASEMQKLSSDATEVLPPTFPQEFAQLSGREFSSLLERHTDQLRVLFNDEEMDMIDQEHQALRRASAKEKTIKSEPTDSKDNASSSLFERAWSATEGRFPALQNFAGGLATVFSAVASNNCASAAFADLPRTSSNAAAAHAMDFALEGALHAQQFHKLQGLL